MKILLIGHPLIVDENRKVWSSLAKRGHEIDVILPQKWPGSLGKKITFKPSAIVDSSFKRIFPLKTYFSGNGSLHFYSPIKMLRILSQEKYEKIILTQETWSVSLLILRLLSLLTKNNSTPAYLWVCQNILKKKLRFTWWFERLINHNTKQIWGCCNETLDVIREKGMTNDWHRLPFSVNPEFHSVSEETSEKLRIGYIGRLAEEKGLRFMIDALQDVEAHFSKLIVAGGGPLKSYVEKLPKTTYLGILPHSKVSEFYKQIDVLILPSKTTSFWKEQFGRVIIESVSHGVPVIGSDSGAIPEVMSSINVPYIFKEDDKQSFLTQFQKVLKDRDEGKLATIVKDSQRLIEENYAHPSVALKIEEYLNE